MKHRVLITALCAATFAVPAGASTTAAFERDSASGSLQLNAKFGGGYRLDASCPAGTPATADECVPFVGGADVRGLGHVIETYTKVGRQHHLPWPGHLSPDHGSRDHR